MPIVGFEFKRITVEKKAPIEGQIKLKNNVSIKHIEKEKTPIGEVLRFEFEFNTIYEPKVGEIVLLGDIIYTDDSKKLTDIIESWKKKKTLPEQLMINLVNMILTKCNIRALSLAEEVHLPPHLNLPKVTQQTDVKKFVK